MVNVGELAQMVTGAGLGLAVMIAAVLGLSGAIRAGERWRDERHGQAILLYALAGTAGAGALAGVIYALAVIAKGSPLA